MRTNRLSLNFCFTQPTDHLRSHSCARDINIRFMMINNNIISLFFGREASYRDTIHVNCNAMTEMCAIVLPKMVDKNKGIIVNISSSAVHGFVIQATYSATKAYMSKLSDCLLRTYCRRGSGKI